MSGRGRAQGAQPPTRFVLFVASSAPSARRAVQNLRGALRASGIDERAAEVVDVFRHPQRALAQRIFATPVLTHAALPDAALYGDLSDGAAIRRFLQDAMEARG